MKVAAIAASVLIAASPIVHSNATERYGTTGWEGYTQDSTVRVSADFNIPNISGVNGQSVAYFAGFGQGNPGIQQAGITGTVGQGWTAWYEMWPQNAVQFNPTTPPHSGDQMQFIVTFSAGVYTLSVNDVTRGWQQSTRQASSDREGFGELICEKYDPNIDLPDNMGAGKFYFTSQPIGSPYTFPFGGTTLKALGPNSFQVSKP